MMKTLQLSLLALKNIPASARLLLICAGLIVLAFRCTERQRANPLDPNNPNTLGKPQGVQVLSKIDTVFLIKQENQFFGDILKELKKNKIKVELFEIVERKEEKK